MASFTEISNIYGPIMGVPEGYVPEVVLSDEEFDAIYARRATASKSDRFHARDYVAVKFDEAVHKCFEEDSKYSCVDDVLAELPKERLRALFWGVDSCSCCITHAHKAPSKVDTWKDRNMADRFTMEEILQSRCHCHCRAIKRRCRLAFMGVPGMPHLLENESDEETQDAGSDSDGDC